MKKIVILISVLFVPLLLIAQQPSTTIKVSARAVHIDDSPEFRAIVSLSNAYTSLPADMTTLDVLKSQYKKALEEKGISLSDLKENPNDFGYETMAYGKEGTLYEYRTKSIEKIKEFLQVKSLGMQVTSYVSIFTIDDKEAEKLSQQALASAKARALIIAKTMGKELGDIQEVEDLNNRWGEEVETHLYHDTPAAQYVYMLNVVFTVK
ncbi:MAG: SIMPL domain-containing protein [Flavobacteriaceae bacterium]|tara:strand:+ start:873 stop:1496 length:624 start_codon:yes stop_codon:yes gene_type:complete